MSTTARSRCRRGWLNRFVARFGRRTCELSLPPGWLEPPPDALVREPRRPLPFSPSTGAAVDLPE